MLNLYDNNFAGEVMEKYQHVISLGHFCAVASELERLGYRDASLPFDWLITPIESVIYMIETNFHDFLVLDNLKRDDKRKYIIKDTKYNIAFYHDYKPNQAIETQHDFVKAKYDRRIKRFYDYITEKTLFIRYIESKKEYEYICENYNHIMSVLQKYNKDNDLMLVSKDIKATRLPMYTLYLENVPYKTPQKFAKANKELYKVLISLPYPEEKRKLNKKRYKKSFPKRFFNNLRKLYNKIIYN